MTPAMVNINAYAKNGARNEIVASAPPIAGPEIPPIKNEPWKADSARARWASSVARKISELDATENIEEPKPPAARKVKSCG